MIKNIEWLKKEIWKQDIVMDKGYIYTDDLMSIINEVDEPEVLSQEWMKDNQLMKIGPEGVVYYVPAENLQNLLVPKQEDLFNGKKPAIPKFMADYLYSARGDVSLMRVLELANTRNELPKWEKEYDWISANHETFARAWLDGFTVEKEQKYRVLDGNITLLGRINGFMLTTVEILEYYPEYTPTFDFTEQEIKDYKEGYWAFAVPVEEVEDER